ncbi:hypothetical protein MKUB_24260 [Mycobacterium kubicae]|uniref:Uncharacterized protein n=1 Tax=Mycobacterium kubicae TaxID=120959 RepID=A0ABQ1BML3_9MYCO|nr:hypothetical protein MKUB_24260 [Mycobacterium kubicae]
MLAGAAADDGDGAPDGRDVLLCCCPPLTATKVSPAASNTSSTIPVTLRGSVDVGARRGGTFNRISPGKNDIQRLGIAAHRL